MKGNRSFILSSLFGFGSDILNYFTQSTQVLLIWKEYNNYGIWKLPSANSLNVSVSGS